MIDHPLEHLLPHAPPMILVDKLIDHAESRVETAVTITSEHIFYDAEIVGVPGWVGVEMMAQTVGVLAGLEAKQSQRNIRLGYLIGVRQYEAYQAWFTEDSRLRIIAETRYRDTGGVNSFICQIVNESDRSLLAEASLLVYETQEEA